MPSIKPELRSLVTPGGAMVLNITADEISTLNKGGGYVWEQLCKGATVDQIIADIARKTGQDVSVITADMTEFLEQLTEKRLVSL